MDGHLLNLFYIFCDMHQSHSVLFTKYAYWSFEFTFSIFYSWNRLFVLFIKDCNCLRHLSSETLLSYDHMFWEFIRNHFCVCLFVPCSLPCPVKMFAAKIWTRRINTVATEQQIATKNVALGFQLLLESSFILVPRGFHNNMIWNIDV